mmetsp:Transcript_13771/g.24873  ORF Transcript_13771/g.24873 Transcript_13771/m.24873 type:complete len:134 (+) Transcript_13771:148-549(+)
MSIRELRLIRGFFGLCVSRKQASFVSFTFFPHYSHPFRLVINTIKDLDPSRRCFRLIGGILVERTIKEVLPAVQKNLDGIDKMVKQLSTILKEKQKDLDEYTEKYDIKPARQMQQAQSAGSDSKSASKSGVLA